MIFYGFAGETRRQATRVMMTKSVCHPVICLQHLFPASESFMYVNEVRKRQLLLSARRQFLRFSDIHKQNLL